MRADRLLSLMMILQTRGACTARGLARELEVSERTIYRDVEALGMAGVPVYAERGPGGGISLLDEYRTNLTGLTEEEARALFMLSIPAPLLQLGVGEELRAAMLKLNAAVGREAERSAARQRIHLDARGWGQPEGPAPHLGAAQEALWQDQRLRIVTRMLFGATVEQVVEPLGLVAKTGEWHLVAGVGGGPRVFRVAALLQAEVLAEKFSRPPGFDLLLFWDEYCRRQETERGLFPVRLRISPTLARELPLHLSEQAAAALARAGAPDAAGWREIELTFNGHEQARQRVLAFGGGAEVLDPLSLRRSVEDFAVQILSVYRT